MSIKESDPPRKPPSARAALALAKSQGYQDAADAPATLKAYAADLANYHAWCERNGLLAMPATPQVVGAYLAAAGEGPRLDAEAVARGIVEREAGERIIIAVADPSIFSQDGGPSIGERMRRARARFRPANNTRVGKAGAMSGWDQVRARITGS